MRFTESVLAYRRSRVVAISAVMIAIIALIDWKVAREMSFGFLYFFPIFLVASCYGQWQIAVAAAICAILREAFGPYNHIYFLPRLFLACGSRVLIETSSAAILTLDGAGSVVQANDAASRLLGTEKDALLGQNIAGYLPALAQVPSEHGAQVFRTTMECEARRRDGETFTANVCFSTYNFSGSPRLTAVVTEPEASVSDLPAGHPDATEILTNLEQTVLRGIFEGQTNKEIAGGLATSESAVKSTIQRLFTKLGARTRSQLVRIAIERLGNEFQVGRAAKASASDQKILSK
jgi:PAS domain S-box-containing protein